LARGDRPDLWDPRELVDGCPGDLPERIVPAVDQRLGPGRIGPEDLQQVDEGGRVGLAIDSSLWTARRSRDRLRLRLQVRGWGRLLGRGSPEAGVALVADELPRISRPAFRTGGLVLELPGLAQDRRGAARLAEDEREELPAAGAARAEVLDGKPNGIPIVADLKQAVAECRPETVIIGVATFGGYIPKEFRPTIREAIENRLNVVAGLHEYLNDDPEFAKLADAHGVRLVDVRKPRPIRDSKQFSDLSRKLPCLRIPVLGTDGAIGKRTTALLLTDALSAAGVPATFVATGQTGLLQGSAYGVPLDSIKADFMVGELEAEIVRAYEETRARVVVVEGQGSISHPAYVCGTRAIINA